MSNKNQGFSLLEIIIVVAIIIGISTIGIIGGTNMYQRYIFKMDINNAIALLQKARSSAINNIGEINHGVYFNNLNNFVLFRGNTYATRISTYDFSVDKSQATTLSGASEVVFQSLSGVSTTRYINISDGARTINININNEGGINW